MSPSGNNKPYYPWEEQLLLALKAQRLPWDEIRARFNSAADRERQRTVPALKAKYNALVAETTYFHWSSTDDEASDTPSDNPDENSSHSEMDPGADFIIPVYNNGQVCA